MSSSAFLAAVQSRGREALLAALSPSFKGKANGRDMDREAQVRLVESFWAGFPDGTFRFEATGGHGHQVITWTFAGTHEGTYLGVPASGAKVDLSGFIIAVSDASGVRSLDWKWDTKAFARQVLGPDDVEDSLPKPPGHRPDPSLRWAREAQRRGGGRKPKRKGPPQGKAPGQGHRARQSREARPEPAAEGAAEAAAPAASQPSEPEPAPPAAPPAQSGEPDSRTP